MAPASAASLVSNYILLCIYLQYMDSTLANHFLLFTNPACVCIVDETWTNLFLLSELDIKLKIVHFGKNSLYGQIKGNCGIFSQWSYILLLFQAFLFALFYPSEFLTTFSVIWIELTVGRSDDFLAIEPHQMINNPFPIQQ